MREAFAAVRIIFGAYVLLQAILHGSLIVLLFGLAFVAYGCFGLMRAFRT
jgi:uncharacterized membrane protein HdeD (DUF308 family)